MSNENPLQAVESVDVPYIYQMDWNTALAIHKSSDDVMERKLMAFKYGFLQGQRAAAGKSGVR